MQEWQTKIITFTACLIVAIRVQKHNERNYYHDGQLSGPAIPEERNDKNLVCGYHIRRAGECVCVGRRRVQEVYHSISWEVLAVAFCVSSYVFKLVEYSIKHTCFLCLASGTAT